MIPIKRNAPSKHKKHRANVRQINQNKSTRTWLHFALSPLVNSKWRYQIVGIFFIAIWSILWMRAFYLQVIMGEKFRLQADRQHSFTQLVEAKRGNIYDRNGQILARSVEVRSIYANPRFVVDKVKTAQTFAALLGLNEENLLNNLNKDRSFIWVSRKVDDATAAAIQEQKLPGVGFTKEYERVYPYKHLAGQLLGFVGIDNHGLEGIERSFNKTLTGKPTKLVVPRNVAGRALYDADDTMSRGDDLHLTLDVQIQFIAEEIISQAVQKYHAKWGGVIIVDAKSGDILAWAQYPFFNPNNFRNYQPADYRNRLASDALEPGSTFKPLVIAAALQEKVVTDEKTFYCEDGTWNLKNITIGDDGRAYKDLTTAEILYHSSNIGMAKITQEMGAKALHSYLKKMGFGEKINVGINESRGILRKPHNWGEVDLLSTGFGQSLSVTGLQMVHAYNILVNDGKNVTLNINSKNIQQKPEEQIVDREHARNVLHMMEMVVDGNGTGKRARIQGVRVAGKTGTAQKAAKDSSGGYGEDRMASFIGIVPAENPHYIIWTMLDEPTKATYGGVIAAPVFKQIATRTMAYSGELPGVFFEEKHVATQNIKSTRKTQKRVKVEKGVMPDLTKMTLRRAMEICMQAGIQPKIYGQGVSIVKQYPQAGMPFIHQNPKDAPNTACILYLSAPDKADEIEHIAMQSMQSAIDTQAEQTTTQIVQLTQTEQATQSTQSTQSTQNTQPTQLTQTEQAQQVEQTRQARQIEQARQTIQTQQNQPAKQVKQTEQTEQTEQGSK